MGGFGVFCELFIKYKKLLFVLGIDGVGIKLRVVMDVNCYDGVGIDLVVMCVNDFIV